MSTVLVVDDAAVDRRLVAGLLQQDADLKVAFAANGTHALAMMRDATPTLVITDLVMPEMDGLQLVEAIRDHFPSVPVILMTSKGNEDIAVQALQRGAASYVPKSQLSDTLLETVQSVLDATRPRQVQARLLSCMTGSELHFVLDNDCSLFPALVTYLQDCIVRYGLFDQSERIRLGIALEEALVNALYHGNLEVSSDLMEIDHNAYYALVEERTQAPPYMDRRIHVTARLSRDAIAVVIRDDGPGFDPATLPDPTEAVNLDKVSGRGLLLMRTFVDELKYNDQGNEVTLVKRRRTAEVDALVYNGPM